MALNLTGFVTPEQDFSGLDKAANNLEKRRYRQDLLTERQEGRKAGAATFLNNYLDKKDFLTGTNYDPEIVKQLQEAMSQGAALASKGADTPTIMMALGPKVNKLNEYATKAKLIDKSVNESVQKLKAYKGYNADALSDKAKKMAFYNEDGTLKDISAVDPSTDWITETVKLHPEEVTTSAGFDDFVSKTPMSEKSSELQTMFAGRKFNKKYEAKHPFWMDISKNDKGEVATDPNGNPIGLDVVSETITDDKGQPMINPETKEPYKVIEKNRYNAIMQHNPDLADYVRGQVAKHFKEMGAEKLPEEGSQQWDLMARSIVRDELKARDKSSFKTIEKETKTTPVTRIELGYNPYAKKGGDGSGEPQDTSGNEFDRIADNIKFLKQKNGVIYDQEGENIFNGKWKINQNDIPAGTSAILKAGGYDISGDDTFDVDIENGKIVSLTPTGGKTIDLQDIKNAQLKYNTEPQKGTQLKFGTKKTQPEQSQQPAPKKEIKRADIATKAAAAGYSVKEYEKLLKEKGVTIKD